MRIFFLKKNKRSGTIIRNPRVLHNKIEVPGVVHTAQVILFILFSISCNETQDSAWTFEIPNPYLSDSSNYTVVLYKGHRDVVLSYPSVAFIFNDPLADAFYKWNMEMSNSEEHYFSTLFRLKINYVTKVVSISFNPSSSL